MKTLLIYFLLCLVLYDAEAQFAVSAEITPRSEFRNGFKKLTQPGDKPAFFIEQRSRLYLNYTSADYEFCLTFQDVRIWGQNGQIHKFDNGMTSISEGWGRYLITPSIAIKVGRQLISYDNERYFGGLEWAMQGRRHDALLIIYDDSLGFKAHAGAAFNQNLAEPSALTGTDYPPGPLGAYHATANYRDLQYLWIRRDRGRLGYSLYFVNEGHQYGATSDSIAHRQTYGVMVNQLIGKGLKLSGEFFYQGGKQATSRLSAYLLAVSATIQTPLPLTLGYDHLSGDRHSTSKQEHFTPAFGTNHTFYGFMDYFYVGSGHANTGLRDIFLKTQFPLAGGTFLTHLHHFLSQTTPPGSLTASGKKTGYTLGTELDLVFVRTLTQDVTLKLGYSQMFATATMEVVKGGDASAINNWAWTQIIFKPKFL